MVQVRCHLGIERLEVRKLLTGLFAPAAVNACSALESAGIHTALEDATASVRADNVRGLRAAEFRFQYDAANLDVNPANIKAGSAWQETASVVAKVDDSSGTIDVFVFSTTPIAAESGELVEFDFGIVDPNTIDRIAADVAGRIELMKSELNEGQIPSSARLMIDTNPLDPVSSTRYEQSVRDPLVDVRASAPMPSKIQSRIASPDSTRIGPLQTPLFEMLAIEIGKRQDN